MKILGDSVRDEAMFALLRSFALRSVQLRRAVFVVVVATAAGVCYYATHNYGEAN